MELSGTPRKLITWLLDQDQDQVFDICKHSNKRSLNANSYFHVLVTQIARAINASNTEVKNDLICKYGQYHYLQDGSLDWSVKPESFNHLESETEHLHPTDRYISDKKKKYNIYLVMRGSHTYNTEEMSQLISVAVSEAKELGIETLTPKEIERMMKRWKV